MSPDLQSPHHVICPEINETYVVSLSPWQPRFSIHGTVRAHLSFWFSMRNHTVAIYNHGNSRKTNSGFEGIRDTGLVDPLFRGEAKILILLELNCLSPPGSSMTFHALATILILSFGKFLVADE